jgi:hypothetical protein
MRNNVFTNNKSRKAYKNWEALTTQF